MLKICSGPCNRKLEVSAENFQRDARRLSGFRARCKKCSSSLKSTSKFPSVEVFDKELAVVSRSTLRDRNGGVVAEWTKTAKSKEDEYAALKNGENIFATVAVYVVSGFECGGRKRQVNTGLAVRQCMRTATDAKRRCTGANMSQPSHLRTKTRKVLDRLESFATRIHPENHSNCIYGGLSGPG